MINLCEEINKIFKKCIDFNISINSTFHSFVRKKRDGFSFIRNDEIKSTLARGKNLIISASIKDLVRTGNTEKKYILRDKRYRYDIVFVSKFILSDNKPTLNIVLMTLGPKGRELANSPNTKILDLKI